MKIAGLSRGICEQLIRTYWQGSGDNIVSKLGNINSFEKEFTDHNLGKIKKEVLKIEKLLRGNSMWSDSTEDIDRYERLEEQYEDLLKTQETVWR